MNDSKQDKIYFKFVFTNGVDTKYYYRDINSKKESNEFIKYVIQNKLDNTWKLKYKTTRLSNRDIKQIDKLTK